MIIVAGEALMDLIADGDGRLLPSPGGGPFNVARALGRLGTPCAFLGAIGGDRFGHVLLAELVADGVETGCVVDSGRPTTLAVAELDDDGAARYRFYIDGTSAPALTAQAARVAVQRVSPRAVHVGSLALALEPIGTAVEELVAGLDHDVLVMVDPNWRPGTVPDSARWRSRLGRVLERAHVVKVSTDDLRHLAPDEPVERSARRLLAGRVRCVLVTDGPHALTVMTAGGSAVVMPPRVPVVDTVGAGDAFCAGFLAWCQSARVTIETVGVLETMRTAAAFGALVAARACQRAGADPPRLAEVSSGKPLAAA